MKRLRKEHGEGIRFFHCGEYGDKSFRPHYHALLFNFDFGDKRLWKVSNGQNVFTSENCAKLWGQGFVTLGAVTFQSAAYVARYVMKKRTGPSSEQHYSWVDPQTGEVHRRVPEYITMSRRPGIGTKWISKYQSDVAVEDSSRFQVLENGSRVPSIDYYRRQSDSVVLENRKVRTPKFYDQQIEKREPQLYKQMKRWRKLRAIRHARNNTKDRLRVRETVLLAKLKQLKREL